MNRLSAALALVFALLANVATAAEPSLATQAQTRFIEVNGERIAYRDFGQGEPIVLLHRFRATMSDWDPAFLDPIAAKRRVILFDSNGVGESEGSVPSTLEGAADNAAGLLKALDIPRADIMGWSMGGMTAQIFAIKHPQLVRHLVLMGTTPAAGSPEVALVPSGWSDIASRQTRTDEDLLYLFYTTSPSSMAAGKASLQRIAQRHQGEEQVGPLDNLMLMMTQYRAIKGFIQNEDGWYQKLATIKAPTLVANGDKDGAFPAINSVVLAREIPNAQLAIYPDSGHAFHFQYPQRFAQDLQAFLDTPR